MTVEELIEELKQFAPHMTVVVNRESSYDFKLVIGVDSVGNSQVEIITDEDDEDDDD